MTRFTKVLHATQEIALHLYARRKYNAKSIVNVAKDVRRCYVISCITENKKEPFFGSPTLRVVKYDTTSILASVNCDEDLQQISQKNKLAM